MVLRSRSKRNKNQTAKPKEENFSIEIFKDLNKNLDNLKKMLDEPDDLIVREFTLHSTEQKCAIAYIDGLVDKYVVHNSILKNLQIRMDNQQLPTEKQALFDEIYSEVISIGNVEKGTTLDAVSAGILSGSTILYLEGLDKVIIMSTIGWETRSVEAPTTEQVIRGSKEGFVENIRTNTSLIRRSLQDPNLRFQSHKIGRRSQKSLNVAYIAGVSNPDIVKEVNRRIESIDMDYAPESGFIEQWIEDSFLSPFPQMLNTERSDKAAAALTQGKIVILLDGTPFVLIAPTTLGNTLQSPEDYYERWMIGSLIRILRYLAAFFTLFLPALYIALVSYQQGMIPSDLAFSIAATRDGVPFPAFVEAVMMGIVMELLREAGARLPTSIGQTIGIVGGLVIGDAAVQAGIVSPVMVIVVALTAIASFAVPEYSTAIAFRMIRFATMISAAVLGLYGIIIVYIAVNIHIVNLKSFGVPYSTPFAPTFLNDFKDLVTRAPIPSLETRPQYLKPDDDKSANRGDSSK
ncbi:spore germination protein [Virgibacillus sp. NKC19-16]|uniref:spore germination protein n=1 Tax=Virgibacillus salidurans TaxID=2831673 RepID=UPI001F37B181|nr:spore germination protein [Virgibacillus sp. NKC19-16]UJL47212.1 spore germination protein [Virgibacillus sp. NKC19-16]